jgi:hypothetical protein
MNISASPGATRLSIDDHGTIAAMEDLFAMLAGLISATGGSFAIAGQDVLETGVPERARVLTGMYDAGEVIIGYADARHGDVVNIVIEHLMLDPNAKDGRPAAPLWRALVYVEEPEGHMLRSVITGASWQEVAQKLLDAVTDGLRQTPQDRRSSLAGIISRP